MKTYTYRSLIAASLLTAMLSACGTTPPAGDPGDCSIDRDCDDGNYCNAAGRCDQDCTSASECQEGQLCSAEGRCVVDAESTCTADTQCRTPPEGATTQCEGTDLVTAGFVGSCDQGACVYEQSADAEVRVSCENGCDPASNACRPPADPCAGVTCDEVPDDECKDADTLYTYADTGSCVADGDMGVCDYMRTEVDCPSGCENGACQQGTCDGVQCGTPPQPSCDPTDDAVSITYDPVGMCVDNNGAPQCEYDDNRTNCAYAGGNCDAASGVCANTVTQSGVLVVTEYMSDPIGSQSSDEWIEVLNTTGAELNLNGWRIRSEGPNGSTEEHVIASDVLIPAGAYALLANGADPLGDGTAPDYVYADVGLYFTDYIRLSDASGDVSDHLYWESGSTMTGRSRKIALGADMTAAANDDVTNWCSSLTDAYGPGADQFGTPKAANTACAADPCTGFDCGSKPDAYCDGNGDVVSYGLDTAACRPTRFNNPFCDFQRVETPCPDATGLCIAGVCEAYPQNIPGPGEVVITEILGAPAGTDTDLEWIELYNTTGNDLALFSLRIEDNEAGSRYSFTDLVDDPGLTIAANSYLVLATNIDSSVNGGITGAVELKSGLLKNTPDVDANTGMSTMTIRLVNRSGDLIDEAYYGTPTDGVSQQLSLSLYDGVAGAASSNDDATGFCPADAAATYGPTTNVGTPGAANIACP